MNVCSVVARSALVISLVLFGSHAANAACVISGVRPAATIALPTTLAGQEFTFIATAGCEQLRFSVPGTWIHKRPKAGPDLGSKDRTYKVGLSAREWNAVVGESDTTFTWEIVGTTSAGVTTRVTTTNPLVNATPPISLAVADAKFLASPAAWGAGDMTGDGHADVLVYGSPDDDNATYLVTSPVTGSIDASSVSRATFVGELETDFAAVIGPGGDVDGDGFQDLLGEATGNDEGGTSAGAAYLVRGPVSGHMSLADADAKLVGEDAFDNAGISVVGADIDDDGYGDVLVGAYARDEGTTRERAGAAYMVLGPVTGTVDLSLADAKLVGEHEDNFAGSSIVAADADGDGLLDMLVGAGGAHVATGAVYVVLSPVTGTLDLSLADAKLMGEPGDWAGGVSSAGDVNGDGHDDVLVGAHGNDEGGHDAGAVYLVLGPLAHDLDLAHADAKFVGEEGSDRVGYGVGAHDVDADGNDDVLIGAWKTGSGAAYVVLGPVTGTLGLAQADRKLVAEAPGDEAGIRVDWLGDVDADGQDDLAIGSYANDEAGPNAGATYLLYGATLF